MNQRKPHLESSPPPSLGSQLRAILAASRPVSWINTAAPFVAAYLTTGGQFNMLFFASSLFFLLPYNLLVYGVNDIFDYESDIKNPRKGGMEGSIVAPERRGVLWAAIITTTVLSGGWVFALTTVTQQIALGGIIILALTYSIKGIRLKEVPVMDSINSALHFVGPAIFGWLISPPGQINWLVAVAFMCWGMASHALGAIQDIMPDRKAQIKSIATQWGAKKTIRFSLALYLLCCGLALFVSWPLSILAALLLAPFPLNAAFFLKYTSDAQSHLFRRGWTNFMWLNGIVGFWLTQLLLFMYDPFKLGPSRYDYILIFAALVAIAQLLLIAYNLTSFKRPKAARLEEWPRVSILIHAYNQADNIASTILAAVGQNYPDFEILFTDLGSDDNTVKIVKSYNDKRLKRVTIDPIEDGWSIEAWAADQLLSRANGEYAVMLSADTVLLPNSLAQIASIMERQKLQLLSLLPADQNKSLAQKSILSHNQYLLMAAYPAAYLQAHAPDRSTAHGGIMAMDVSAVLDKGGFSSIKASPLEDQELFHRARQLNLRSKLYRASDLATSQNHQGIRAIFDDDIQRYYPALRFHFPIAWFMILGGLFLFSGPAVILIHDLVSGQRLHIILALTTIGLQIVTRIVIALETKQSIPAQLLAPLTNIIVMGLLFNSILHYELLKPRWQNRTELTSS